MVVFWRWPNEFGFPVEEGFYDRAALDGCSVFATTATRGVVKIATLDGVIVPDSERLDRLSANFWPTRDPTIRRSEEYYIPPPSMALRRAARASAESTAASER